ncbi:acyl-CoA dehydrogenase family protein [Miltoncostaea oceani]|uniref:acyl-CoA dehydrogenase family protein n=1 Tax=Miltoncostaea oceani TaxID=2843216 RepID=UPI001C3C4078|nr:acyl-CoA dehydrogenase family protein [Miltoncostaea oceani]
MIEATTIDDKVDAIATEVVRAGAGVVDETGEYPRAALASLRSAGVLGLISATEVGGLGEGPAAAARVVERLARECASTAMVLCMHYAATAVIEAHGPIAVRERIATGEHLSTLAFSEVGSRAQFWAPLSAAETAGDHIALTARKSWVTSAAEADSYVWSSRPVAADGLSTLWLVPATAPGLHVRGAFDGLGLRGNGSTPIDADAVAVAADAMLGSDGGGFDVMLGTVLPIFLLMGAGASVGLSDAAAAAAAAHAASTRFEHLDQSLAEQPVTRSSLGAMRVRADAARALWSGALEEAESGRETAALRALEAKAAASEAAITVTDAAMRVCGGAAFRREVAVERHFRDARAAAVMAPTTEMLHDLIGRAVTGQPLFG